MEEYVRRIAYASAFLLACINSGCDHSRNEKQGALKNIDTLNCELIYHPNERDTNACKWIDGKIFDSAKPNLLKGCVLSRVGMRPLKNVRVKIADKHKTWEAFTDTNGKFKIKYEVTPIVDTIQHYSLWMENFKISFSAPGFKCLELDSIPIQGSSEDNIRIKLLESK